MRRQWLGKLALNAIDRFCKNRGIALISYSKSAEIREALDLTEITEKSSGICYKHGRNKIIFYDDTRDENMIRHIQLHEIGHSLTMDWENIGFENKPISELPHREFTAEIFACMVDALMFMEDLKETQKKSDCADCLAN